MSNESKTVVFYRCVKAQKGHPCAGLYGVEKVFIKDNVIYKKELVHEWDLRIISEAILAKMGGTAAYDAYAADNDIIDPLVKPAVVEAKARTSEDIKAMPRRQLKKELGGK